jgi:hypothetical protein
LYTIAQARENLLLAYFVGITCKRSTSPGHASDREFSKTPIVEKLTDNSLANCRDDAYNPEMRNARWKADGTKLSWE